jgi:hypothetical protein
MARGSITSGVSWIIIAPCPISCVEAVCMSPTRLAFDVPSPYGGDVLLCSRLCLRHSARDAPPGLYDAEEDLSSIC